MREQVIKSMPWVSALMVTLAAATAAVGELADAAHFFLILTLCVCAHWFASDSDRWNRYMGWLPDELKGKK